MAIFIETQRDDASQQIEQNGKKSFENSLTIFRKQRERFAD